MTPRGRLLAGTLVVAIVLLAGGVAMFVLGIGGDHDAGRVLGIIAFVSGLVCLRILFWVRRARLLADVGRSFQAPEDSSARGDL